MPAIATNIPFLIIIDQPNVLPSTIDKNIGIIHIAETAAVAFHSGAKAIDCKGEKTGINQCSRGYHPFL